MARILYKVAVAQVINPSGFPVTGEAVENNGATSGKLNRTTNPDAGMGLPIVLAG